MDYEIADMLRRTGKSCVLVVNKVESKKREEEATEFYALGFGDPYTISALHGMDVDYMLDHIVELLPPPPEVLDDVAYEVNPDGDIVWTWAASDHLDEIGFTSDELKLVNGIPGLATEQAAWTADEYSRAAHAGIHLYRLHGCVSWVYHPADERVFHHRFDLLQQRPQDLCVMIPGKEIWRGKNPRALAFRELYNNFRCCDVALFIGFSFRDLDVKQLLLAANAVRLKKAIRLVVVDNELNRESVFSRLDDASRETQFPVKFPEQELVTVIRMRFGEEAQFAEKILNTVKGML